MNPKSNLRPSASELLNDPWILKKVDDPLDDAITQNALKNLRKFRVRIPINILKFRPSKSFNKPH